MPPTPKSTFGRSNSSRLVSKVVSHSRSELSILSVFFQSSAVATMRSPRAGRIGKGISPRVGGVAKVRSDLALSWLYSFNLDRYKCTYQEKK